MYAPATLMAEVAPPGEDHGDPVLVRGFDDLLIAHGAAGLNDRSDPGDGRRFELVELELEPCSEPEQLFDELVNDVPPGSMGLVLQPYWSPGVKIPGPEAKGAIIGFGDVHTRAHIYRAIIEGLAYALREGKECLEKRSGHKISTLKVSGGGSRGQRTGPPRRSP